MTPTAQSLRLVPRSPKLGDALSLNYLTTTAALTARHLPADGRERMGSKSILSITDNQHIQQHRPVAQAVRCPPTLHTRPRRSRSITGAHGRNCCSISVSLDNGPWIEHYSCRRSKRFWKQVIYVEHLRRQAHFSSQRRGPGCDRANPV
jgi:hypothetical protein